MPAATSATSAAATASETASIPDLALTPEQHRRFELFGFLKLPGLIADRIGQVIADFERVWTAHGGGHHGQAHDGQRRSCIYPFIDQDASLSTLLDDPRIHGLATSLLGEDFNYVGSDGNFYAGETGWHADGAHTRERFIKIAIYLDRLDGENGALRVVPGSHRIGEPYAEATRTQVVSSQEHLGLHGREVPAIILDNEPGDVLVFNHNLLHAAFNGGARRRMFTLNLCQHHQPDRLEGLVNYLSGHARFFIERNVGPAMLSGAGPRRMRHLRQVMENDYLIAQRLAEYRRTATEPSRG